MKNLSVTKSEKFGWILAIFILTAGFLVWQIHLSGAVSAKANSATEPEVQSRLQSELQKITAPDGVADDFFGTSTAIDGDTIIVGASGDDIGSNSGQGSVYVFVKSGNTWTQQAKLVANDGAANDSFGNSVAIDGDTVIIGAHSDQIGTNTLQGSAYIFVRTGTTWTQQAKLIANDGANGDVFGTSVAIDANTVVIGATGDDFGTLNSLGSAYVFTRTGATWAQQTKLTSGDTSSSELTGDQFGTSVSISNNTISVGVGFDSIGTSAYQGSVYIFVRSGTAWSQQTRLIAADGASGDGFGRSSAISGDTIIVASLSDDIGTSSNQGSAYIYVRTGTTWTQQAKLTAGDGAAQDFFGISVAIDGNRAIVSSTQDTIGANAVQGSAYLFVRTGTAWMQADKFTASDGAANDGLGTSVGISGSNAVAGATGDDIGANSAQGSAYIFTAASTPTRAHFDFDGDGKADVSVFRLSNGTWYLQQSTNGFTGVTFGASTDLLTPADYDGDGKTDVAVFRPSTGTWYLQRSSFGFTGIAFGQAGDVPQPSDYDGDGKADLAVFRPSNGTWYLQRSTLGFTGITFGQTGDKPVAADYDGDGKADVAVYRNGTWYIQRSLLGFTGIAFGESTDKPVPADYDADGKADVAVFRPSNGTWYLLRSTAGFTGIQFGLGTDSPVPADYDGDGKTDVAVFRDGNWYLNRSTQGFTGVSFGAPTDQPVPNAFVR